MSRLIEDVLRDPVEPLWGKNQRGMQDAGALDWPTSVKCQQAWHRARMAAVEAAEKLAELGAHKQVVNRVLEPFSHINFVVTSTEWSNFFKLRAHKDAQPEMMQLAQEMRLAIIGSMPVGMPYGHWHLPYLTEEDEGIDIELAKKISAARCARVSYVTHDGRRSTQEEDLVLFDRLAGAHPMHLSPLEHQATPLRSAHQRSGNFKGWSQFRQEWEDDQPPPANEQQEAVQCAA